MLPQAGPITTDQVLTFILMDSEWHGYNVFGNTLAKDAIFINCQWLDSNRRREIASPKPKPLHHRSRGRDRAAVESGGIDRTAVVVRGNPRPRALEGRKRHFQERLCFLVDIKQFGAENISVENAILVLAFRTIFEKVERL